MYYVRYASDGLIGRYHVEQDKERENEENQVEYLKNQCNKYNQIADEIDKKGFPDLCPSNYIYPDYEFPLYMLAPYTKKEGVADFPCDCLIGGNWANLPRCKAPEYPKWNKVRDILKGNLNINNWGQDTKSDMKPIEVYKIFNTYINPEGNHRLYIKRLMGEPTVRAEIYEVDYMYLLNNSILIEKSNGDYIGIRQEDMEKGVYKQYDINETEKRNYLLLRKRYLGK